MQKHVVKRRNSVKFNKKHTYNRFNRRRRTGARAILLCGRNKVGGGRGISRPGSAKRRGGSRDGVFLDGKKIAGKTVRRPGRVNGPRSSRTAEVRISRGSSAVGVPVVAGGHVHTCTRIHAQSYIRYFGHSVWIHLLYRGGVPVPVVVVV